MSNALLTPLALGLMGLIMGGFGWFLRELWASVKELRTGLATLKENLPMNYVQKDDYKIDIGRVYELLDKIYDKLHDKQDRPFHVVQQEP